MSDLLHRDKARCGLEAVAALLLLVALCSIYCYILPKPIQGIPYNSEAVRSPLGDVPAVINDKKGVVDWLLDQAHRHNRPICQVFLRPFGRPFVLISDFREAHDIMLRRKEWDRSDFTIELLGGHAPYHHINQKTNQVWKTQRRLLQDLMMPKFLNNVAAPNIYASTLDLVKLWDAKERLAAGRPFSAEKDVFNASLDAVLEFSFGDSFPHRAIPPQARYAQALTSSDVKLGVAGEVEFADQPVHATIEATLHASVAMGELMDAPFPRLSWWIRSKLPTESRQIRLRHGYIKEQVLESMRRMRAETDPSSDAWVRSAVDMMMRRARLVAEKEGRQPVYWSPAIRDEVFGFVIAGHDTTSTTTLWGLKFVSDSQEAQEKLREALRDAHARAVAEKRIPTADEITHTHIPYLEAVIEEILRLSHPLPVLDRQATCDTELFGHHIPKGTIAVILNRGPSFTEPGFEVEERLRSPSCQSAKQNRGAREWHPDGMNVFRPERWLTTGDDGCEIFDATAGPTLPFGLGTRGCYGRKLAYLEMRIVFTLLVWQFRLRKCPSELSGYGAVETLTHKPRQCYVNLERLDVE